MERSIPDWKGTVSSLQETLEDTLLSIQMGQETGVRDDIIALEAYDMLDRHIALVKLELGIL